jgi:hypothetical protein
MLGSDGMDSVLKCAMSGTHGFLSLCPIVVGA